MYENWYSLWFYPLIWQLLNSQGGFDLNQIELSLRMAWIHNVLLEFIGIGTLCRLRAISGVNIVVEEMNNVTNEWTMSPDKQTSWTWVKLEL